jgi:hypothetical protein
VGTPTAAYDPAATFVRKDLRDSDFDISLLLTICNDSIGVDYLNA